LEWLQSNNSLLGWQPLRKIRPVEDQSMKRASNTFAVCSPNWPCCWPLSARLPVGRVAGVADPRRRDGHGPVAAGVRLRLGQTGGAAIGGRIADGEMLLFFIPALMSLLDYGGLLRHDGWRILLVIGAST
jgi:hypothetical protein